MTGNNDTQDEHIVGGNDTFEQDIDKQTQIDQEKIEEVVNEGDEVQKLKDALARQQADYDNFKKRVERDRGEMMFFFRADILNKILPRIDDIERIITSTPEEQKQASFFTALESTYTQLVKDLEKMGCVSFVSKGEKSDPERHEVMTQSPGEEGIVIDEFVKGYMLGDKVLRHAKVVVGSGI